MINETFLKLMTLDNIGSEVNAFTSNYLSPFMEIDPNSYKCSITADRNFFVNRYNAKDFIDNPNISIYFNNALYSLFPSFPYMFNSSSGDLNYKLVFEDLYGVNSLSATVNTLSILNDTTNTVTNTTRSGIQIVQEISSVTLWNCISSIVFTSSLLPIVPTQTSKAKVYDSLTNNLATDGQPNISNIITDFEIVIDKDNQYRPDICYSPTAEYRLIDMYSTYNLNKIDISVFWKDKFGNLNPIYLNAGCSANVKLLFRKKIF